MPVARGGGRRGEELADSGRPAGGPAGRAVGGVGLARQLPARPSIAGVITAIILLLLLIGPYQTHLQDFWMIGVVRLVLGLIAYGTVKRRNAWRR